jgi:hypothetical protein
MQHLCRPPTDLRGEAAGLVTTMQAVLSPDSGFRLRMGITDCTVSFRYWQASPDGVFSYGETDPWRYDPAGGLAVLPLREQIPAGVELVVPIVTFRHAPHALLNFAQSGSFVFQIGERRQVFCARLLRRPGETRVTPMLAYHEGVPPQDLYVARWERAYRPFLLLFRNRPVAFAAVPPLPPATDALPAGLVPLSVKLGLQLAEDFFQGPPPCVFEACPTRTAGSTVVRCFFVFPKGSTQDTFFREAAEKAEAAGQVEVCRGGGDVALSLAADGEVRLRDGARRRRQGGSLLLCGASLVVAGGSVLAFRFGLRAEHFRRDPVLRAWLFSLPLDAAREIDARLVGGYEGREQARTALREQLPTTELDDTVSGDLGGVGDALHSVVEEEVQGVIRPETPREAARAGDQAPEVAPEDLVLGDVEQGRNESVARLDVHGGHGWWPWRVPAWLRAA